MFLEDEIDDPSTLRKPANRQRLAVRTRHIVYLQLLALILSVPVGRCEEWGYGAALETGFIGMFFGPVVVALFWSAILFPFAVLAFLRLENPQERWSWVAAPLSILMSFTQILAFLPLLQ